MATISKNQDLPDMGNHPLQDKTSREENLKNQIEELELINIQLESMVAGNSLKLAEVVETNSKFLSIIAHDLRSPFTSIIGILNLLKDNFTEYKIDEINKYIDIASISATHTLSLLDNLLSWTFLQNKAKNFNPVKIDLPGVISNSIDDISITAIQKQITIKQDIAVGLFATADLQMVKTILRNLLSNAVKYSFKGGEVVVKAARVSGFIEIGVFDNGVGISAASSAGIFGTKDFTTTRGTFNEPGTGLGLKLCKEFVEMHGGSIRFESEKDSGSRFIFTLPRYI